MVREPKIALDGLLEGFRRESSRLLRLRDKKYNVAVIGCGDVGENTIALLKDHPKKGRLVISNRDPKKSSWLATDEKAEALPYENIADWLVDENPNKDIDVVIFAAGPWIKDRAEGLKHNVGPIEYFAEATVDSGFNGLSIIVNNPVAALCHHYAVKTGCDPYSVIGFNSDPNRWLRELARYLNGNNRREGHINNLRKEGMEDEIKFYERLLEDYIEGLRLSGAHAPEVEMPDGKVISCRIPIWKEARIRGKGLISDLFDFGEFRGEAPGWISKEHDKEDALRVKYGKKAGPFHARTMVNHFISMIDGEVEGMGPIVFDAERGVWAARPANCIYHRVQPMSDEEAGIVGEIREQFEDVCKYYIGSKDEKGERYEESCIGWLVKNGFMNDKEERYLKYARGVAPPGDKEKVFGQKALRFITEEEKRLDDFLENPGLTNEEKAEYRSRFEEAKKEFLEKAGLFDLGNLITINTNEKNKLLVQVVSKNRISNSEGECCSGVSTDIIDNLYDIEDVDGNSVYCRSGRDSKNNPDSKVHLVNLKDMGVRSFGPIAAPIKGARAREGVIYVCVDLSKYSNEGNIDKIVRLNRQEEYDMSDFADAIKKANKLPTQITTFDVSDIGGVIFASSSDGIIYRLDEYKDKTEMKEIVDTSLPITQLKVVRGTDLFTGYSDGPVVLLDKDGGLRDDIPAKSRFFDVDFYRGSLRLLTGNRRGIELRAYDNPEEVFTEEGRLIGQSDIKVSFAAYNRIGLRRDHVILYRKDNSIEISNDLRLLSFEKLKLSGNVDFSRNILWRPE